MPDRFLMVNKYLGDVFYKRPRLVVNFLNIGNISDQRAEAIELTCINNLLCQLRLFQGVKVLKKHIQK